MSKERYIAIYQGDPDPFTSERKRYTPKCNTTLKGVLVNGSYVNVSIALNGRTELLYAGEGDISEDIAPDKRVFQFDEPIRELHIMTARTKEQEFNIPRQKVSVYLKVEEA